MESFIGIVERITFHSEETGWSVLQVSPNHQRNERITVTVHQSQVFAGATLEFKGEWVTHKKFGEQFKAIEVIEHKPASTAALEKYLGSGLIYGVGPATAKKIVKHFGKETLNVFENKIDQLLNVPGIAKRKLEAIKESWQEHREIREIMLFLQQYGISSLFAVKIYKEYENESIQIVSENPYQLSKDIYGIGFFSADKVALNMGFASDSPQRIGAGLKHILDTSREEGHCFLTLTQLISQTTKLLGLESKDEARMLQCLDLAEAEREVCTRSIEKDGEKEKLYYAKSLFYDEKYVAEWVSSKASNTGQLSLDLQGSIKWLDDFNQKQKFPLSDEQHQSVFQIAQQPFSILTGGPGCGKTTTTNTLVKLLLAHHKEVLLAAPTGRAAQRMGEVIGREAKTIHRLLVWEPQTGRFKKGEEEPLDADFIIVDECSMLDISLTASLMKAIPPTAQVLFIGDVDQLPSVGAGNVLKDLIDSQKVPCYALTKVFRQAQESFIISNAHNINKGIVPKIESPINDTQVWDKGIDCLFIDSEEASQEQKTFIKKVSKVMKSTLEESDKEVFIKKQGKESVSYASVQKNEDDNYFLNTVAEEDVAYARSQSYVFNIPQKFLNANINKILSIESEAEALKNLMKKVHPWSSLHYGFTASEMMVRLYTQSIPEKLGNREIQILSPMTRGSLGTQALNLLIQEKSNPPSPEKPEIRIGNRIFRLHDRIIQKRNNYDLEVFNGDIGRIVGVNTEDTMLEISFKNAKEERIVIYQKDQLIELDLAYSITIHKSQGSEFDVVIIPVVTQHFTMLYRNLIYTGLTRAKKMAIFVGTRKALSLAVKNIDNRKRQTYLKELIE